MATNCIMINNQKLSTPHVIKGSRKPAKSNKINNNQHINYQTEAVPAQTASACCIFPGYDLRYRVLSPRMHQKRTQQQSERDPKSEILKSLELIRTYRQRKQK